MKIHYKEPFWVKFEWEINEHHDNQYVTEFDKTENPVFYDFLHKDEYVITTNFKIGKNFKKDDIGMVFGKPGKNLGLSYNHETKTMAFEFWTSNSPDDTFNFLLVKDVSADEIENGLTISIVRDKNKITIYKNFEENNSIEFENNLIDDYKDSSFFVGCSNPDIDSEIHRYYTEVDINHLSFLSNSSDIMVAKEMFENETHILPTKNYYDDILFYYDFKTKNNLDIIYDESKYTNFLERVPEKYIK